MYHSTCWKVYPDYEWCSGLLPQDESQAIVLGALREAFGTEGWECKLFLKVWDDMLTKAYRDTLLLTYVLAVMAHAHTLSKA